MSASVSMRHRLEPISREGDPGRGLAAGVHDPLWMLGRQYQFGEFDGEDTGSPVEASFVQRTTPLTSWRAGPGSPMQPIEVSSVLEATITGERSGAAISARDRLDAGRRLLWLLPESAHAMTCSAFPLSSTPRFPDGIAVAESLTNLGFDPATIGLSSDEFASLSARLGEFNRWVGTTFGLGPDVWIAERVERQFDLVVGGGAVLHAQNHTRNGLDWFDLDIRHGAVDDAGQLLGGAATTQVTQRRIPSALEFPGMPNDRFWEFEDGQVALHAIDAAATDLARLALVEFSTVYGNDWFSLPFPTTPTTTVAIDRLIVVDTFGRRQLIRPAVDGAASWAMHAPTDGDVGLAALLVTGLGAVSAVRGPVTEEVSFVRDEMANLVWAVERLITDDEGVLHDLLGEYAVQTSQAIEQVDADLLYRLMTEVPDHWIPFIPVHLDATRRQVGLVQAVLPRPDDDGSEHIVEPRSAVLRELRNTVLREEEVPNSGIVVRRNWWLARAVNGTRVVWAARSVEAGRGEGHSGLVFDLAEEQHTGVGNG